MPDHLPETPSLVAAPAASATARQAPLARPARSAAEAFERIAAVLHASDPKSEATARQAAEEALRIGVCSSLSWGFMRELLKRLGDGRHALQLSLLEGSPQEVLAALRRGEIDAGFVRGVWTESDICGEELWREPYLALISEHHPLAKGNAIEPGQLRRETFLISAPPAERGRRFAELASVIGGAPAGVHWLDVERETLINLAGLGFGVALSVSSSLGVFYPGLVYRPVTGKAGVASFSAVWRERDQNPRLGSFLATVRAFAARWALEPVRGPGARLP